MDRTIRRAIVHCSYTPPEMDIGANEIRRWHKDRGWTDIGYHFVIRRDGTLEAGRPIARRGAHARGHNDDSVGICLVGGQNAAKTGPDCNFTLKQYESLRVLKNTLEEQHTLTWHGHREFSSKSCPCFDVGALL